MVIHHPHALCRSGSRQTDRASTSAILCFAIVPCLGGFPELCAELDRYDIAVVFKATYVWEGYRYTNAADAIAAAKRGVK